jgi:hypothetical protein
MTKVFTDTEEANIAIEAAGLHCHAEKAKDMLKDMPKSAVAKAFANRLNLSQPAIVCDILGTRPALAGNSFSDVVVGKLVENTFDIQSGLEAQVSMALGRIDSEEVRSDAVSLILARGTADHSPTLHAALFASPVDMERVSSTSPHGLTLHQLATRRSPRPA